MNRISGSTFSHYCSHSQGHRWMAWSPSKKFCTQLKLMLTEAIMVQNSPYLFVCYTNYPRNSTHNCTLALLQCCQNITFFMPSSFVVCISSWEGASHPQSFVHDPKYFVTWNSAKWIWLSAFSHSSHTISITGSIQNACQHICCLSLC